MLDLFLPIALMVLGGFLLGLLVGKVAWSSSKPLMEPRRAPVANTSTEAIDVPVERKSPASDEQPPSDVLPVWEMEEVVPAERYGSNPTSTQTPRFRP